MSNKQRNIDKKLVLEYQSGSKQALTLLVKRYHKTFCEKALWIVKDADIAKDIAQDSWNIIIDKISKLKDPSSFKSWALRIVYNKSLDLIKAKQRTYKTFEVYKTSQSEIEHDSESDNELLKNLLLATVKTLTEPQQIVLRLFYVQDYSLKEISDILNISVGTAKSRLFHAREKLKETLKNKNYEN